MQYHALSRLKQGFDSPRERQPDSPFRSRRSICLGELPQGDAVRRLPGLDEPQGRLLRQCSDGEFLPHPQNRTRPSPAIYESEAEGLLENVEGEYHITEVTVLPRVILKSDAELEPARKTMEGVEAHCFIANSINARVTLTPEFVVAPPPK